MTQEEKDLLLKDICGRVPYNVKISINDRIETLQGINVLDNVAEYGSFLSCDIEDIKPYLFPLSSMTEEQKEKFNSFFASVPYYGDNEHEHVVPYYFVELLIDFFHENHIDNNSLIPKGLAIDATGLNIY